MPAKSSAMTNESHTPSIFINMGRSSTARVWNTRVRRNEISAEISPLLSAVKKDEPKMLMPLNKNENEKI